MRTQLKVLILEYSSDDVTRIDDEISRRGKDYIPFIAKNKNEFQTALHAFHPDLVLSAHLPPDLDADEAHRILQEYTKEQGVPVPFILLPGANSLADNHSSNQRDRPEYLPDAIEIALEKTELQKKQSTYISRVVANEALMKEAESLAHLGSWSADLRTGKYTWSDETYRIYGYEPQEITPNYEVFLKHVHPEDRDFFHEARGHVLNKFDSYSNQFRIIDKHGTTKYLASKIVVKRDTKGTAIALIGFSLDISEKSRSEIELQIREQEYKALFDQHPDPAFLVNLQGNFTRVNKSFAQLTGVTEIRLLGKNIKSVFEPAATETYLTLAHRGDIQRFQTEFVNTDKQQCVLEVILIPITINDSVTGIQGIIKDVTK